MTHCMNLELSAFLKIANGSKTIELRLNDEKRQKIKIGDTIEFHCGEINSIIFATVIKLHKFPNFEQLYKALPLEKCGYSKDNLKNSALHGYGKVLYQKPNSKIRCVGYRATKNYGDHECKSKPFAARGFGTT